MIASLRSVLRGAERRHQGSGLGDGHGLLFSFTRSRAAWADPRRTRASWPASGGTAANSVLVGIPPTTLMRRRVGVSPSFAKSSRRKRIASQCASVSSIPIWAASDVASGSLHSLGIGQEALVVDVDDVSVDGRGGHGLRPPRMVWLLPGHRHVRGERDGTPGHQHVPVDVPEGELAQVVGPGLLEEAERADVGERVLAGQRLGVVVEVDQHRLVVTGLHEAVRVAVEGPGHRLARDVLEEVVDEDVDGEVGHRAGLRRGDVAGVADGEDRVVRRREQRVLVDRDVVQLVAEAGTGHEVGAHVQGHGDRAGRRAPRARRRRRGCAARASIRSTMKSGSTWILRSVEHRAEAARTRPAW